MDLENNIIATFSSVREAARKTGLNDKIIQKVCKKYYGRKTHGGFKWKYLDEEENPN